MKNERKDDQRIEQPSTYRPWAPHSHRCGRCGERAAYDSTAPSGAWLFICHACHPQGHPTLVAAPKTEVTP